MAIDSKSMLKQSRRPSLGNSCPLGGSGAGNRMWGRLGREIGTRGHRARPSFLTFLICASLSFCEEGIKQKTLRMLLGNQVAKLTS